MTSASLSIDRLVAVSVTLSPAAAQAQSLSSCLILGDSGVIDTTERMRTYTDLSAIAADFGSSAPEYLAAALWFQQSPRPGQVLVGRWAKTATHARLTCAALTPAQQSIAAWNAVSAGAFRMTLDGELRTVSALDFSTATNMNAVAAVVQTALVALVAGSTCAWDAVRLRFVIRSGTTGTTSTISLTQAPVTGTDVSGMLGGAEAPAYATQGVAAEQPADALATFDDRFGRSYYGVQVLGASDDQLVDAAGYIEAAANKHLLGVSTQDPNALVSGSSTNVAARLKAAGYKRSFVAFSSATAYAASSLLARILTTNYNGNNTVITLMYKQAPGIVAERLTEQQAQALASHNCNVFAAYNNSTAIIQPGVCCSGEFIDVVTGTDALAVTLQTALYNALYTSKTKIPQTDAGNTALAAVMEGVCQRFVDNGLLAPGQWDSQGFGAIEQGDFLTKGFYIYTPPISTQTTADRAARKSVLFQVAAKLAGAIHTVDVQVDVNR